MYMKFDHKSQVGNMTSLVELAAWRQTGVLPLPEAMIPTLLVLSCDNSPKLNNLSFCSIFLLIRDV